MPRTQELPPSPVRRNAAAVTGAFSDGPAPGTRRDEEKELVWGVRGGGIEMSPPGGGSSPCPLPPGVQGTSGGCMLGGTGGMIQRCRPAPKRRFLDTFGVKTPQNRMLQPR